MATFNQISQQLRQGKYSPVYFLYGDEAYFIDSIMDHLAKDVLSEGEKQFNLTVLYGMETDSGQILDTARRFPMMAERQVVLVREAQNLRITEFDKLESYMEDPVPTTILAFAYKGKKPDRRKKVFKLIEKNGVLFESKPISDNKLPEWIENFVHHYNRKITPKASFMVAEHIGNNLSTLVNELNKVMLTVGEGKTITEVHIADNIGVSKDFNVFELQSALINRDRSKAMKIAFYFGQHKKEHPFVMTLGMLARFYMNLMLLYFSPGLSASEFAKKTGVHPFYGKEFFKAKNNYTAAEVVRNIGLLREYDLRSKGIKGGSTDEGELLKELIFRLTN